MASTKSEGRFTVTRTPLRVSFVGGGTDIPAYFERDYGAVVSAAIDRYLYVTVKDHDPMFNESYRLNYSITEHVNDISDIQNDIARECLRLLSIEPPIYIGTTADLPAMSGLGSSSSFAVGLLNALHAHLGEHVSPYQLAEEAAHVEISMLKRPVGKQDHYAAAFGGLNELRFYPEGRVVIEPLSSQKDTITHLFNHMLLLWTGVHRPAHSILGEQLEKTAQNLDQLNQMRGLAEELGQSLRQGFDPGAVGNLLQRNWDLKRGLAGGISNAQMDEWYQSGMEANALGGKLCGAGGGGFLMFLVAPEHRHFVEEALPDLTSVAVGYAASGSQVIVD